MSFNGWIDGKVEALLEAAGITLPGGDGETLRAISRRWDDMAENVTQMRKSLTYQIGAIDDTQWSGEARTAFEQHWHRHDTAIAQTAEHLHRVADGLRHYAAEIDKINNEIVDICAQIAEMEAAGLLLTAITGGISDALANTAVAAKVARVSALVEKFTLCAEKVTTLLKEFASVSEELAETIGKIAQTAARIGVDATKTFTSNLITNTGSAALQRHASGSSGSFGQDATTGAEQAAGTAVFGASAKALSEVVKPGVLRDVLAGEGKIGNLANGALGNMSGAALADGIDSQGKDGIGIAEDIVGGGVAGAHAAANTARGTDTWVGPGKHWSGDIRGGSHATDKAAFGLYSNFGANYENSGITSDTRDPQHDHDGVVPQIERLPDLGAAADQPDHQK
jgi:WXG100 family type VII secretion target